LLALLYGQLSGACSLREIVTGLSSHAARLYHLGADPVRRSTFSDANARRPAEVFAELLDTMMKQAHRGLRRKLAETTYLIDATSVRLNERSAAWARFSAGVCGAKGHVIYDADADRPIYAAVSAANLNDITAAHQMPIEPGATYVFDLGYYDYAWWAKLDAAGCRIVTRFKSNTPLEVVRELPVPVGSNILSDRIGFLPARQAKSRRNPMQDAVREVRLTTDTRKGAAHPVKRSRCECRGDCRSLSPPVGHRAVLPLDQANAQDHPLRRHLRERGTHPDRCRPHRLPAAAPGSGRAESHPEPDRL
jgi:Transposase DDE domain/Domain of unknown function (DUF4372)